MPRANDDHRFAWSFLLWHPVVWFLTATIASIVMVNAIWKDHLLQWIGTEAYQVRENNLVLSPYPEWLEGNVLQTKENFLAQPRSLLNTELVSDTKNYLGAYPWVRNIHSIQKNSKGLSVDLSYRSPVAFVDVGQQMPIPVDGDGVVFDTQLLNRAMIQDMKKKMLRIAMPQIRTNGIAQWREWPDQRVKSAAELSEFLAGDVDSMELLWLVTFDLPNMETVRSPGFEIWTSNAKILWGSAPGQEQLDEASPVQKIESLRNLLKSAGSFDQFAENGAMMIDITTGNPTLIPTPRVSQQPDWMKFMQ